MQVYVNKYLTVMRLMSLRSLRRELRKVRELRETFLKRRTKESGRTKENDFLNLNFSLLGDTCSK